MNRCLNCNRPFGLIRHYIDYLWNKRQFCSKRCREEWLERQKRKKRWLRWLYTEP